VSAQFEDGSRVMYEDREYEVVSSELQHLIGGGLYGDYYYVLEPLENNSGYGYSTIYDIKESSLDKP